MLFYALKFRFARTLGQAFTLSPPAASAKVKAPPTDRLAEVLHWLKGTQKNRRPRKRKGLAAHLFIHFGKKTPEGTIQAFIDQLIADKQLSEVKDAISYHF